MDHNNSGSYKNISWVGPQMKKNGQNNNTQRPMPYQQPMQQHKRQMQMQQPPPPMPAPLTQEQLAFEVEFGKWEKSFLDWQKAYANHPDRVAYKQYEQKFLAVRDKLFVKRTQIYSKTSTERKLANELGAAAAMAESILHQFGESSAPSFSGNSNRFSNPPPILNMNSYEGNMMRGQQDYSRPPRYDQEPPGRGRGPNLGSGQVRGQNMGSGQDQGWSNDRNQRDRGWSNERNQRDRGWSNDRNQRDRGRSNDRNQRDRGQSNDRNQENRGMSNDRNHRDIQRGGNQQWGGMNQQQSGRDQQRNGRSGERQGGFDRRQMEGPIKKPNESQLKKEMERKNIYPNVPW